MIILTGASGGIGGAILPALAQLDDVMALSHSKGVKTSALSGVTSHQMDVTSERDVNAFARTMKSKLTHITLIHAAALSRDALAAKVTSEDWDHVMNVNLRGNFLLTRALLLPMIEEKWGRIIHLSSAAALRGVPGTLAYATAKTGLLGLSRVLATEHARFGITSNVLVPGYFNTGLIETLSEKNRQKILDSIPSGRLGDPMNIVHAIEFLRKADYVTGATIPIDGGFLISLLFTLSLHQPR